MNYKNLPPEVVKEMRGFLFSLQISQTIGSFMALGGFIICFIPPTGFMFGIPIIILSIFLCLIAQLVDDTRRNGVLLKHLFLYKVSHTNDFPLPPPPLPKGRKPDVVKRSDD